MLMAASRRCASAMNQPAGPKCETGTPLNVETTKNTADSGISAAPDWVAE
jgi:hypothetical protein